MIPEPLVCEGSRGTKGLCNSILDIVGGTTGCNSEDFIIDRRSNGLLKLHSDLGTKHSLINRLMTIIHENGEKGLHNE